jgi:oxidase EvaA
MKTRTINDTQIDFLVSSLHHGSYISTIDILDWMKQQNKEVKSEIKQIPLSKLNGWNYSNDRIQHQSGKFFSIDGIHIKTNYRNIPEWDQPIINQPEIGFLGFIVKKFKGVFHFLMQAKIEPGNLNLVQLSPTLQATRSNYTRVHKGVVPKYLEYFNGERKLLYLLTNYSRNKVLVSSKNETAILLWKFQRTKILRCRKILFGNSRQIKELLRYPNIINMDSRTVISCINFGNYSESTLRLLSVFQNQSNLMTSKSESFLYSVLNTTNYLHDLQDIIQWITALKFKYELEVSKIGISKMAHWIYDGNTIHNEDNKYFSVMVLTYR